MEYLRIDPRLDEHPDVLEAGFIGSTVFQAILRAVASFDKQGHLPKKFGAKWLVRRMNIRDGEVNDAPENWVTFGIEKCITAGLIVSDGDELCIPGWEKFYKPEKTNAQRQNEYRARNGSNNSYNTRNAVTESNEPCNAETSSNNSNESNATPLHSTPHNSTPLNTTPQTPPPPAETTVVVSPALVGTLRDRMEKSFFRSKRVKMRWDVAQERDLAHILPEGQDEILRRWEIALETPYPRCSTVRELVRHFEHYAAPPPTKVRDKKRDPIRAEDMVHSDQVGEVHDF